MHHCYHNICWRQEFSECSSRISVFSSEYQSVSIADQKTPVIKGVYVHNVPVTACGGYLSGIAGTFSYPNNPGHDEYDHDVSCAWVIHTLSNKVGCVCYIKGICFSCDFVAVFLLWASEIPISKLKSFHWCCHRSLHVQDYYIIFIFRTACVQCQNNQLNETKMLALKHRTQFKFMSLHRI